MRKSILAIVPLCAGFAMAGGPTVFAASAPMTEKATLSGMTEVGKPGASTGHGTATIRIYASKNMVCYTLNVSGIKLPAAAAHIHAGKAGKSGPVVIPFQTAPSKSGKATGCVHGVKSTIIKAISNHPSSYYVNVHTTDHPDGAVRGQLGM